MTAKKSPNAVRAEIQATRFLLRDIAHAESTRAELADQALDAAAALSGILSMMLQLELEEWWNAELAKRDAVVDEVFFPRED